MIREVELIASSGRISSKFFRLSAEYSLTLRILGCGPGRPNLSMASMSSSLSSVWQVRAYSIKSRASFGPSTMPVTITFLSLLFTSAASSAACRSWGAVRFPSTLRLVVTARAVFLTSSLTKFVSFTTSAQSLEPVSSAAFASEAVVSILLVNSSSLRRRASARHALQVKASFVLFRDSKADFNREFSYNIQSLHSSQLTQLFPRWSVL